MNLETKEKINFKQIDYVISEKRFFFPRDMISKLHIQE